MSSLSGYFSNLAYCFQAKILPANNDLKTKVGGDEFNSDDLSMAQDKLDKMTRIAPVHKMIEPHIEQLKENCKNQDRLGIERNLMNISSNGGMFNGEGFVSVSKTMSHFIAQAGTFHDDTMKVVNGFLSAFHTMVRLGNDTDFANDVNTALEETCEKYFKKHPTKSHTSNYGQSTGSPIYKPL